MTITLDIEFQDVIYSPTCVLCVHCSDPVGKKCAAFPAGIPAEIWNGNNSHRKPYAGDHGIQFAPNKQPVKGGPGSGFHGHAGRPGEVGGSAPAGTAPVAPAESGAPVPVQEQALSPAKTALKNLRDFVASVRETEVVTARAQKLAKFQAQLDSLLAGDEPEPRILKKLWSSYDSHDGMLLTRYLSAKDLFALSPDHRDYLTLWAKSHAGDMAEFWPYLPKWAEDHYSSFLAEAAAIPESIKEWKSIPIQMVQDNLTSSDLATLVDWPYVTGKQVDPKFLDDFMRQQGFEESYRSFAKDGRDASELIPYEKWAELPGANWRTVVDMANEYADNLDTKMIMATIGRNKDVKFADILDKTNGHLAYHFEENPQDLADLVSKYGDNESVRRFMADEEVSFDQLSPALQKAVGEHFMVIDAHSGEPVPVPSGQVKMAEWFKENSSGTDIQYGEQINTRVYTDQDAVDAKKGVVEAVDAGMPGDYVHANEFVKQWAETSNDTDMRSLGIQEIAADELGGQISDWQRGRIDEAKRSETSVVTKYMFETPATSPAVRTETMTRAEAEKAIRGGVRRVYKQTQAALRKRGIDAVTLYRGVKGVGDEWEPGDVVQVQVNALSSWTLDPKVAFNFSGNDKNGHILSTTVPASWVYSTPMSGPGCLPEEEVVVIGREPFHVRVEK